MVRESWRFYEAVPVTQSRAMAEAQGKQALEAYLETLVSPYGEILSTLCSSRQKGAVLVVTLRAECREEIGRSVPIYTEESGQ